MSTTTRYRLSSWPGILVYESSYAYCWLSLQYIYCVSSDSIPFITMAWLYYTREYSRSPKPLVLVLYIIASPTGTVALEQRRRGQDGHVMCDFFEKRNIHL